MQKSIFSIFFLALLWSCSGSKNANQLPKEGFANKNERNAVKFGETYIDAAKEKVLGNFEAAEEKYKKALEIYPDHAAANYELGNIYILLEKNQLALDQFETAAKIDSENYWYQLALAAQLRDLGKSNEAISSFKKLIELKPNQLELKYELAQLLLNNGKKSEGIEVMNEIEEELGVTEEVSFLKKKVYLSENNVDAAANEVQKLIDSNPNEIAYYGVLAEIYSNNGKKAEAIKVYERMHQLDSTNYRLQYAMAEFYRQDGKDVLFNKFIGKAFANPEMPIDDKVKYVLSFYQVDSRNKEEKLKAIALCKRITKAHPDDAKSYALLADFQYFDNQVDAAKSSYIKTIELDSSRFPVWNQLIFIFADQADTASLVDYSKRAIDLFPNQPTVYLTYGIGLSQQENYEEAIEYLKLGNDLALDNQSLKSQFLSSLGDAYHGMKDDKNSDLFYDKALVIDPNNIIVLNNYAYYLSVRNQDLEKARKMSAKSNNLAPNQASFQDTYAWILFQLEEYETAKTWINKAIDNSPKPSAELLEHKGDILFKLKDKEQAVEFWNKAKKKGNASKLIDKKIKDQQFYE